MTYIVCSALETFTYIMLIVCIKKTVNTLKLFNFNYSKPVINLDHRCVQRSVNVIPYIASNTK